MATPPRPNFNLNNVIAPDIGGSLIDFANQQSKQFQLGLSNVMAEAQARRAEEQARRAEEQAEREKINFDRLNKDREALVNFNKGMLQPQVIGGIITDSISPEQVGRMSFTPEELAQYNAAGGDLSKLTGSVRTKAELQNKLSSFADNLPSSPEFQESNYQQAKRVASGLDLTPGILEELKKYQVADITAQKEAKKDASTYAAEAKELETKIAQLKTKQGSIYDKATGVGTEWGKRTNSFTKDGKEIQNFEYADLVKHIKESAKTDSDDELSSMLKAVYDEPKLTKKQKEDAANNILISAGAYNSKGFFDTFKKDVDIAAAKKANEEYFDRLERIKSDTSNDKIDSSEIAGLGNEIALLEARRDGALAKANSYSGGDRTSSARELMGSRLDALLGGNNAILGGNNVIDTGDKSTPLTIRTNNPGAVKNASRSDKNVMWEGQTGFDEQGHAVFSSPEFGARAMAKNLQTQIEKGRTLNTLLQEYATGNQDAYIKNVSAKTGIDPNQKLTEGDIRKLMGAMVEHEAGVKNPFSADVLDKGYELALGKTLNSNSITPESKDVDVKALFANVKTTKDKEVASTEINKLTELYKSLGGTGKGSGSAGVVDDLRIKTEAEALSKELKIPTNEIMEAVKSQARQDSLTAHRNKLITKRMFETNMNKLRKDPAVQAAYDKAWKEEARRRGYIGTSVRPFSLDKFIKDNYSDRLKYK